MTKTCKCGREFEVVEDIAKYIVSCQPCRDISFAAAKTKREKEESSARLVQWKITCPKLFQETVKEKLPKPAMLDRVLTAWSYETQGKQGIGLVLHGPTGTGKSRCAWKLCEREWVAGRSVKALVTQSASEFAMSFEAGTVAASRWAVPYKDCQVLLCDDVWKTRMSDAWEAALFSIVESRCVRRRPTLFTMNDTSETLAARMSQDRGAPLTRRIKENSVAIHFAEKR